MQDLKQDFNDEQRKTADEQRKVADGQRKAADEQRKVLQDMKENQDKVLLDFEQRIRENRNKIIEEFNSKFDHRVVEIDCRMHVVERHIGGVSNELKEFVSHELKTLMKS